MADCFLLEPEERTIRVVEYMKATWTGTPLETSEDQALERKFLKYNAATGNMVIEDHVGLLKERARRTITNFTGLPGKDGKDIPFSPANLDRLCEMHAGLINKVMAELRKPDALLVEATEKNS